MVKPVGHRGSWFATWEGRKLPCVHEHWTKGRWPAYCDRWVTDDPQWPPFIEAIKTTKTVILTQDTVTSARPPGFTRTGYIGLFRVEDVEADGGELRFRITERLADFR